MCFMYYFTAHQWHGASEKSHLKGTKWNTVECSVSPVHMELAHPLFLGKSFKHTQAESWQPALTKCIARVEKGLAQCLERYQAIPQRWGSLVIPLQAQTRPPPGAEHPLGRIAASLKRKARQRADPKHFKQLGQRMETLR